MRYFGLAGKTLSHSFSRNWFRDLFARLNTEADYVHFEGENIHVVMEQIMHQDGLEGFNVTIPYKREILPFCDLLSEEVVVTGAANCIAIDDEGVMTAYNTDTDGFRHLLSEIPDLLKLHGALILGTGGASAAVRYVLGNLNIPYTLVSRVPAGKNIMKYPEITAKTLELFPLIINTTPLGMWPDINQTPPFPYHLLSGTEVLIDLIYNPEETLFLQEGKLAGCNTRNGMSMLIRQAEKSWEIWNAG